MLFRSLVVGAVGSLLVLAGVAGTLITGAGPLPVAGPRQVVFTAGPVSGLGVAVLGALVLAGVAGWLLGRDQRVDQG